ncbi:MAG: hypothetical protein MJY99_06240 [Fibrobacter sp.]|nr:hypothetical protein [Fibrobacter sp.]
MFFFFFSESTEGLSKRVFDAYGLRCEFRGVLQPGGLPLYMVREREIVEAKIGDVRFALVGIRNNDEFGAEALKNQAQKYELVLGCPIAFVFEKVTDAQKKSLINRGVPFLAVPALVFLPFLGIALQQQIRMNQKIKAKPREFLSPQAQQLFLHMLYRVKDSYVTKARVAKELGINPMSVTRSSRELESLGLIKMHEEGRSVQMTCAMTGYALVKKALSNLINPVQKNIVVERNHLPVNSLLAGESALSKLSLLGGPTRDVYACAPRFVLPKSEDFTNDAKWLDSVDLVNVQIWKYDPAKFAVNGTVDPVSLYLSLRDSYDERIQSSLDEMMGNVRW